MGKIMEAVFCIAYIIVTFILGGLILRKSNGNREYKLFGVMTLVLVFGDSFHLIPRIFAAIDQTGDYHVMLGLGKLITSITMTIFYLILFFIYSMRYKYRNTGLMVSMVVLAIARIVLCLMPQNDWTGEDPVTWGIIRNIPFTIMGIIMIILYFKERKDSAFKWMWLAITLSFAFYIPVVLWSDLSPMVGMLMLPKTCMYVWAICMGYKEVKTINQRS
ncbi:MAG: hypothetical protein MJ133_08475 [Lachnospiraceae bacterium]|nr:hypothetical protein [Lachnospiraceae bacterium]